MKINSISFHSNIKRNQKPSQNINFEGRTINGNYYEDDVIALADKMLKGKKISRDSFKKCPMQLLKESQTSNVLSKIVFLPFILVVKLTDSESPKILDKSRVITGLGSLGMTELTNLPEIAVRKILDEKRVTALMESIKQCADDIKAEKKLKRKKN